MGWRHGGLEEAEAAEGSGDARAFIDAAAAIKEWRGAVLGWGDGGWLGAVVGGFPRAGVGRVGWRHGGGKEEKAAEGSGDEDGAGGRVST